MTNTALLLIDIQNDFCAKGALAVPEGDAVVAVANQLIPYFDLIIASQDWHPPRHQSFASSHIGKKPGDIIKLHGLNQVLWPEHCVTNTKGAAFHPELHIHKIKKICQKGTSKDIDSYSAFFDNARLKSTALHAFLQENDITTLYMMGLATDYCVKFTALDAIFLGYRVYLITDGCRAVNLHPHDSEKAILEMQKVGVHVVTLAEAIANRSANQAVR